MSVWQAFAGAKISIKKGQSLPFPFFVISACNPLAIKFSWQDNQALHLALHRYLASRFPNAQLMEVVGHSADNQWEEPSWAIHGISREEACDIARYWRQLAFFCLSEEWLEIVDGRGQMRIKKLRNVNVENGCVWK